MDIGRIKELQAMAAAATTETAAVIHKDICIEIEQLCEIRDAIRHKLPASGPLPGASTPTMPPAPPAPEPAPPVV